MEGVYAVLLVLLLWASAPEVANASRRYPYFPLTSEEEGPARQPLQTQRPFNIAHRGSNGEFPEATAGAYLVSDLVIFSISLPHDLSTYSINPKGLLWHRCFIGLPPHSPPSAWWHNIIGLHMKCKYCQFQQKWHTSEYLPKYHLLPTHWSDEMPFATTLPCWCDENPFVAALL